MGQPVPVHGLVVPVDARDFTVKAQPEDVTVINRGRLGKYLRKRPPILGEADIWRIFDCARRSSTWAT